MAEQSSTPVSAGPKPAGGPGARRAGPGGDRRGAGAGGPGGRRRGPFRPRRKVCRFCVDRIERVDFKQVQVIRTFTTDRGKILSSRVTGNCATHQRQLSRAVKRARYLALLPFSAS